LGRAATGRPGRTGPWRGRSRVPPASQAGSEQHHGSAGRRRNWWISAASRLCAS